MSKAQTFYSSFMNTALVDNKQNCMISELARSVGLDSSTAAVA